MGAAALDGREQPSTHTRHMPVTSPRLVLLGPISANTQCFNMPWPTPIPVPKVWGGVSAHMTFRPGGPVLTAVHLQTLGIALNI